MCAKQESASEVTSRHGRFDLILVLYVKMVEFPQQHANTTQWL